MMYSFHVLRRTFPSHNALALHGIRSFSKTSRSNSSNRFLKYTKDFVKTTAIIAVTPLKTIGYLGGFYGVLCLGYSLAAPSQWALSDHNVLLTGILRVFRTVSNAVFIVGAYKYYFWGLTAPEEAPGEGEEGPPFARQQVAEVDMTPQQREYNEVWHHFWEMASNRIANVMIQNGGIYIKLGQAMATYSAILPAELGAALKPLLTSILGRKSGEIEYMFVEDLGDTPAKLFRNFKEEPIAGASIAQVFVGETPEGQKVAIKVQYFDIAKRFKMDKGTVQTLLKVLDYYFPGIPFLSFMPHIFNSLVKELDFVTEGENSERSRQELKHLDFLYVPKVHWNLSSKRILTMDFAEGVDLVDAEKVKACGFNSKELMTKIIRIFSEQIFATGHIHADPHPGNLMVRKNPDSGKAEIVLIDHGLYENLNFKARNAFAGFWHSVIIDDYGEVQRNGKDMGLTFPDLFATMLFLKPYGKLKEMGFGPGGGGGGGGRGGRGGRKKEEDMTEEEKEQQGEFRKMGQDLFNSLPKQIALIMRNLRLIAGINLAFGVPVNRTRLMAEVAVQNSTKHEGFFTHLKSMLKFEWHFFYLDMRNRAIIWALWIYSWFKKQEHDGKNNIVSEAALFLQA